MASCGGNEGAPWPEKCEGLRLPAYISIHQPIQLRRLVRARATIRLTTRGERDGGTFCEAKEEEGRGRVRGRRRGEAAWIRGPTE